VSPSQGHQYAEPARRPCGRKLMSSPLPVTVSTTVSEAIAEALASMGVRMAFTFPGGGSSLPMLAALRARGIETVLTRSEAGGVLMAATAADISNSVGVVVVGLGPGAASAVNGVAHAWLDRSPIVVIVDRYSEAEAATTGHQLLDQAAMLSPVVKACVDAGSDAAMAVSEAIRFALEPRRGPVLVELRRDRARMPADAARQDMTRESRARPDDACGDAADLADALAGANRPVLLLGEESRRGVEPQALVKLAEILGSPVLTTYKAKGVFPESHRLAAGILTGAAIERPLLDAADVMLAIGVDPVELLPRAWAHDARFGSVARLAERTAYFRPEWRLVGDLNSWLHRLIALIGGSHSEWPSDDERPIDAIRRQLRVATPGLAPWRVVEVVQEVVPDPVVTVDSGAHMFAVTWFWNAERPDRFHISNGLATMGFAIPAAVAASITCPSETVIAFTGDGGFTMNAAELETAVRANAKIIVIAMNDASLSLIAVKQDELGLERSNVDFGHTDLAAIATGLGARGVSASTEAELRRELRMAVIADVSTVIDVALDGREYGHIHRMIRNGG